jgi:hypothetical protein
MPMSISAADTPAIDLFKTASMVSGYLFKSDPAQKKYKKNSVFVKG